MARSVSEPHTHSIPTDVTAWGASRGNPRTEDGCDLFNFTSHPLANRQPIACFQSSNFSVPQCKVMSARQDTHHPFAVRAETCGVQKSKIMTWTPTLAVSAYREWTETTRPSCSQHAGKVMGRVAFVMKLKVFSPKALTRLYCTELVEPSSTTSFVITRQALGANIVSVSNKLKLNLTSFEALE